MSTVSPCRLHFLLASEANVGIIIRRGPSRWVQLIQWNTSNDNFEQGQWFHGRVFEDLSHLSPNGNLFLYAASNYHPRNASVGYTWTAISRPPYFTAIAFWASGWWCDGGIFLNNSTVALGQYTTEPRLGQKPGKLRIITLEKWARIHGGIFLERLMQDGWAIESPNVDEYRRTTGYKGYSWQESRVVVRQRLACSKVSPDQKYTLAFQQVDKSPLVFSFSLRFSDQTVPLESVEWADFDQQGRLVISKKGKILSLEVGDSGQLTEHELADFNASKPEPVLTPNWAKQW